MEPVSQTDRDVTSEPVRIQFTVYGVSQPAGSKQSFVPVNRFTKEPFRRPDGGIVVSTVDANRKSTGWKEQVAFAARQVYQGELLTGPLKATFIFYRCRPAGHSGANGLNKKGREAIAPTSKPDVLKLARAVEDACTKVLWHDDAQIVDERLEKRWGEPARVEITIEQFTP